MTQNHVLFQTNQFVDFASQRGFGQHFGRFLERCSTDETVGLNSRFGDPQQLGTRGRSLWTFAFCDRTAQSFDLSIRLLERFLGNDRSSRIIAVAGACDLDAIAKFLVGFAELESVHHQTRQQVRVARILDLHLAKHAGDDDFTVLVVNFNTL